MGSGGVSAAGRGTGEHDSSGKEAEACPLDERRSGGSYRRCIAAIGDILLFPTAICLRSAAGPVGSVRLLLALQDESFRGPIEPMRGRQAVVSQRRARPALLPKRQRQPMQEPALPHHLPPSLPATFETQENLLPLGFSCSSSPSHHRLVSRLLRSGQQHLAPSSSIVFQPSALHRVHYIRSNHNIGVDRHICIPLPVHPTTIHFEPIVLPASTFLASLHQQQLLSRR